MYGFFLRTPLYSCSVVECRSVKLQEYDLPAQAVIDVLKLNDARKRGNNNSQA